MLFRNNIGIVLLSLIPVIVLIGTFSVDTVTGHETWLCGGLIKPTGNDTPGVSLYCFGSYGSYSVNYTHENAYFYNKERAVRDADENIMFDEHGEIIKETVLGWFLDQKWVFSDGRSCEPWQDTALGRIWSSGYWKGTETKEADWENDVVWVDSHTKSYEAIAITISDENNNSVDLYCVCPTYRQDLDSVHKCGGTGLVNDGNDFSEKVSTPKGSDTRVRIGEDTGTPFYCFEYPGYPDADCDPPEEDEAEEDE